LRRTAPVWRDLAGEPEPLRCGDLSFDSSIQLWSFRFAMDYLRHPDAIELDPVWLRTLGRGTWRHVGAPPPGTFADLAISGWSLDLARRAAPRDWDWWERLVLAPPGGFGALSVGEPSDKLDLRDAVTEALGRLDQKQLLEMGMASSSGLPGGERPKLFTVDRGVACLIKFAAPGEPDDAVIAEATALSLASEIGCRVPTHSVRRLGRPGTGPIGLQVQRFDRDSATGSPIHAVSAATALGLEPASDAEDPRRSYPLLRSRLREPGDARELFDRIVLNAIVHNSDDHPWNHSLLQTGRGRWVLSPLYDVLPFHAANHPMVSRMDLIDRRLRRSADSKIRVADPATLIQCGVQITGLDPSEVFSRIVAIHRHVQERWRPTMSALAASVGQRARLTRWCRAFEGYGAILQSFRSG
jgi:serine/threonine-protein kinase HipA